jgi:hypothetical protein
MTKKQLLDEIKNKAKQRYSEPMLLYYKGENVACLKVPAKATYESIQEYMQHYEVASRGKGVYLLTIKFGYSGSINILTDSIMEVLKDNEQH